MNEAGIPTPEVRPGVYYFLHEPLAYEARRAGVIDDRVSQELFDLRELRIAADYLEEDVTVEEAREALDAAAVIVRHVLGEEPTW